jgi:hypothetical protein
MILCCNITLNKRMQNTNIAIIVLQIQEEEAHGHLNRIGGVMVSMLPSSAIDRSFKPRSGQTKD